MYPNSYYAATANPLPEQPSLGAQSIRADVCVIGAGFTGLSTALHLAERGSNVVILEAQRIGWGASGRNGGQLYGGQRKDVGWLEARIGKLEARRLWDLGEAAKHLVKRLISELSIDCDLTPGIASVAHKPRYVAEYHALADKLATQYGRQGLEKIDAKRARELLGTDAYFGGYVDWDAAHLHPLNLAVGVARRCLELGVTIYENTQATAFMDSGGTVTVRTTAGSVTADQLVLAANGHLGYLAPRLAGRMMPINNFMIATEPLNEHLAKEINPRRVAVGDSRFVINYFRMTPDRRLLFGGGENYRTGFPHDIASFVRPYMLKIYPQLEGAEIDYAWGGTLAITLNRMPHFGHLSDHVHFAHGYSGQGVGLAHLAGQLITEMLHGDSSRFDAFATIPTRPFPGGRWLRWPGMVAGMLYFAARDRI
jgi:gamma-glutamylputrescine oxidase